MPKIPVPCTVCGVRTTNGSRCERHSGQAFRTATSCVVCGRRSAFSYCDEHRFGAEREEIRKRQKWRAGYSDPEYRKNRELAIRRDGGRCAKCGRSDLPLEVDHRIPLSKGGTNALGNLVCLCVVCHREKTLRRRKA